MDINKLKQVQQQFSSLFPTWLRVEPRCRRDDISEGLQAAIADPLWFLTRQWQMGEFQAEVAGSPAEVRINYSTQSINQANFIPTEITKSKYPTKPKIPKILPLEVFVEQEEIKFDWNMRVKLGQRFEEILNQVFASNAITLINVLRQHINFELMPNNEELKHLDNTTLRFVQFMRGRVIDGSKILKATIETSGKKQLKTTQGVILEEDKILATGLTIEILHQAIERLENWYHKLYAQPKFSAEDLKKDPNLKIWQAQKLAYDFSFQDPSKQTTLVANDYRNGDLDWYAFSVNTLGNNWQKQPECLTYPTRINFNGTSPRWWAFEDSANDLSNMDIAKPDLAKLIFLEFVLIYADDWFSVPLKVVAGNLVKIDGLKVIDVFGDETSINSGRSLTADPLEQFDLFSLTDARAPNKTSIKENLLFVPPVCGFREESPPVEEIRFMRDEGANKVWGIEHIVSNGLGKPVDGFALQREFNEKRRIKTTSDSFTSAPSDSSTDVATNPDKIPKYSLATTVPDNWVPFVPVLCNKEFNLAHSEVKLRRARIMCNDGVNEQVDVATMTKLFNGNGEDDKLIWLDEETVMRAGLRVLLTKQRIRWIDGETYVWVGRKVLVGCREGNSGLKFDVLE